MSRDLNLRAARLRKASSPNRRLVQAEGAINTPPLAQMLSSKAKQRYPDFWSDLPVRNALIAAHRQMTIPQVRALLIERHGRAPSKSAIHRFWMWLDEMSGKHVSETPDVGPNAHTAPVLDDIGFATKAAFRHFAEKRRASIAKSQLSIAEVLKLIDQRIQAGPSVGAIPVAVGDQLAGFRKGVVANRALERIGCGDMREDQLLESVDAVLQFLELALRNPGHGESPVADDGQPTAAAVSPHRLSETSK